MRDSLKNGAKPWYEVTLHQGRNQQIRRMFQVSGHPVDKLRRVKIGFLEDKKLKAGEWRFLAEGEVQASRRVQEARDPGRRARRAIVIRPREILQKYKQIAVVGLSSNLASESRSVAIHADGGYTITPVNPNETEVLGQKAYASLDEVPDPVEIVNIFRRSEFVPDVVEAAIRRGAKVIWMQEGVVHEEAAKRARAAGMEVVMDLCILKERMKEF